MKNHNVPRTIAATAAAIAVGVGAVGAAQRGNSAPTSLPPVAANTTPGQPEPNTPGLSEQQSEAIDTETQERLDDSFKDKLASLPTKTRSEIRSDWAEQEAYDQAVKEAIQSPQKTLEQKSLIEREYPPSVKSLEAFEAQQAENKKQAVEGFDLNQQADIDNGVRSQVMHEHMTPVQRQAMAEVHERLEDPQLDPLPPAATK